MPRMVSQICSAQAVFFFNLYVPLKGKDLSGAWIFEQNGIQKFFFSSWHSTHSTDPQGQPRPFFLASILQIPSLWIGKHDA